MDGTRVGASQLRPLKVVLINPKYQPFFWGYDYALPFQHGDKRCWTVTGALPALAAAAPPHCSVEVIDENVEEIDFERLDEFDVIGVTGMVVQADRMREILERLSPSKATIVVGGPYVSVVPELFEDLCDVRFLGEADDTWPEFLNALGDGRTTSKVYRQSDKTDMSKVPTPRYDLMKSEHYMMASLQFSRGCPFQCEFCDIITIFGRVPRLKTVEQMVAEMEEIHRAGFKLCFLVDDNLIGNKREAKRLLRAIAEWQEAHDYPIQLYVEASINLADDPELLELMLDANVRHVFIGIESPRASSLEETKKVQNVRGDSLLAKVQRVRDAGLVIKAGFIVGFDSDDDQIFEDQYRFIQEAGIAQAIVAILAPIPTTPLFDRLSAEGRIDYSHPDVMFRPKLMTQDALKAGYDDLMIRLYQPDAFFERLFAGYAGSTAFRQNRKKVDMQMRRGAPRWSALMRWSGAVRQAARLGSVLAHSSVGRELLRSYARSWARWNRPLGRERIGIPAYVSLCVEHWHFFNIAQNRHKGRFGNVRRSFEEELERAA
jgi:radical SAM superfamily enzyme YgiQ (UPF0313 family)